MDYPMNYKEQKLIKKSSAFKGFTIIELVVVLAILGALVSMMTIFVSAFIRDAKMETADENAQLAAKAVQSVLTEYEIQSVDLKAAKYTFKPSAGPKETRYIFSGGLVAPGVGPTGTIPAYITVSTDTKITNLDSNKSYKAITKYLPEDFAGTFLVTLDDFEYSVTGVVYTDTKDSSGKFDTAYLEGLQAAGSVPLPNRSAQASEYRTNSHCVGSYPYTSDIT